jgi:DNA polymerase IIIc chi subunit
MSEHLFYQFNNKLPIAKQAAILTYRIYESSAENIFLFCKDEQQLADFDKVCWNFSSLKFLPHGKDSDPKNTYEKILLSNKKDNLNNAEIIISNIDLEIEFTKSFKKIIYIFQPSGEANIFSQKHQFLLDSGKTSKFHIQNQQDKWQKQ